MPLLDQFPLTVHAPDGDLTPARVIEVAGEVLIFTHDGTSPRLARRARLTEAPDSRRILRRLATEAGEWTVEPEGGCGCRHPLKRTTRAALLELAGMTVG